MRRSGHPRHRAPDFRRNAPPYSCMSGSEGRTRRRPPAALVGQPARVDLVVVALRKVANPTHWPVRGKSGSAGARLAATGGMLRRAKRSTRA